MDLVSYVFGFLGFGNFWDFWILIAVNRNVLLALYIGFGGYLTLDSGFEFEDLGFSDFGLVWDFWILITVNPFQNM